MGRGFSLRVTGLFAETWFYRDPLAPLGAPAGNYFLAALGLHARAKSVHLRSLAPVGLECTLGQSHSLLIASTVLRQTVSINHFPHYLQTARRIRVSLVHARLMWRRVHSPVLPARSVAAPTPDPANPKSGRTARHKSRRTPSSRLATQRITPNVYIFSPRINCAMSSPSYSVSAARLRSAPSLRQLPSRYLTAFPLRVLNIDSRKSRSRTFPHNKKICATMPD